MKTRRLSPIKASFILVFLSTVMLTSNTHASLPKLKMCVFTILGESDPSFQPLQDYAAEALKWGAKLELKAYMNEQVVVEEFKAGACDIAVTTSLQSRIFNNFSSSVDSPGGVPSYEHLKIVLQVLAKPSAAKYMKSGEYETIGIQPTGAVFLFTNDRSMSSLADLAGKKMSTLESMPEMRGIVSDLGMTPVSSTVSNMFQKFNNGAVDVTAGPGIIYDMMEMHKGLEPNGGILDLPIIQSTLQITAKSAALPPGFGQSSREYLLKNYEQGLEVIRTAEKNIPKKWWFSISEERAIETNAQYRKIRLAFRDAGVYDPRALTLLRKIRCKVDKTLAECTSPDAE